MLITSQAANALVRAMPVGLRQKIVALVRPCAYTVEDAHR